MCAHSLFRFFLSTFCNDAVGLLRDLELAACGASIGRRPDAPWGSHVDHAAVVMGVVLVRIGRGGRCSGVGGRLMNWKDGENGWNR